MKTYVIKSLLPANVDEKKVYMDTLDGVKRYFTPEVDADDDFEMLDFSKCENIDDVNDLLYESEDGSPLYEVIYLFEEGTKFKLDGSIWEVVDVFEKSNGDDLYTISKVVDGKLTNEKKELPYGKIKWLDEIE